MVRINILLRVLGYDLLDVVDSHVGLVLIDVLTPDLVLEHSLWQLLCE